MPLVSPRSRRGRALALLAGAVLIAATGCRNEQARQSPEEGRANAGRTIACPPPDPKHDPNATFTWMYSVDNTSFDPDRITTNNSLMYLYPLYDALTHIDADGKVEPMLAKSWRLLEDNKVLEMKLVENAKFHDGTPIDADAVRANIERHRDLKGSYNAGELETVKSVEAVDQHTVRFVTEDGAAPLVNTLAGSAGMMMSPRVLDDKNQASKPTGGSGAFKMTRSVSGDRVEYTAVDDYWDPDAQNVKKLVMLISGDDNARLSAVTTGAADATFLRVQMIDPAKKAGLIICQKPNASSYTISLNTKRSKFGDRRVRLALNHAINRDGISQLLNGLCQPSAQLLPRNMFGADPSLTPGFYRHDPGKAKELLRQAGLSKGFQFEMQVINLDIYLQIAQLIQQNLSDVGIKMDIHPVPIAKLGEDFSVNKTVDASLSEQKAELDPSILTADYYLPDGFSNPGGFTTPELTRLHEEGLKGGSDAERAPVYAKLMRAAAKEAAPNLTLCHVTSPSAMNKKVNGLEIYADASRQFRGVSMTPNRK
ncbi:MAG: hypothetical protein GEV11_13810 [Streptosporangiales bacterium]|nr:hypothetical protein [Streptosporangiales bacterium]